ncbi:MAG: Cof-type HAD-IIB family hydrolase [Firmicutes bacterium]|nr:Cof-type HAD-IIB family hydrolase [Bacillota bacterium]MDH7494720.1 Cof-type HAD-IIB family hydrolase [Bacillota bacterium]
MRYRLLVTDIDGTLVDSQQRVPEENAKAIRRLAESGALFTFATGRNEDSVRPYARALETNVPAILYNGAKVVDLSLDEVVFERCLSRQAAAYVLKLASSFDVHPALHLSGGVYVRRASEALLAHAAKDGIRWAEVGDLARFLEQTPRRERPTKILIIGDDYVLEGLRRAIHARLPRVSITKSEPTYLEVLPPGVSKGAALLVLCRHLGIDPREVVAVGDGPNDLSLIQTAGLGVAVANAAPGLKEHAGFVSKSNEECAIAEVIERFF